MNRNKMELEDQKGVSKDVGGIQGPELSQRTIPANPFANVKRELSDDELQSPAVQKLLLNDNYRMEKENEQLKEYEALYHQRDKEAAVLNEKLKASRGHDILYTACEAVGSLLVGVAALDWQNNGMLIVSAGAILVMGGIIYKFFMK